MANIILADLCSKEPLHSSFYAFLSDRKRRELTASGRRPGFAPPVLPKNTLVERTLKGQLQHVDLPTQRKKEWVLTKEAFDGFLSRLDIDREKAGAKYESVRLKLLKYFQWRGSDCSDIETDETINRVARRIEEGENVYNLNAYIYGVAKLVYAESFKTRNRNEPLDEASRLEATFVEDDPEVRKRQTCFERCLGYLTDVDRETITEYYQFEKGKKIEHRKQLADRFGISMNALRIKAHRLRMNLEACMRECLGRCA
jgi:DNA-directed RNA polymerase specialized sigma24 family protein